MAKPYDFAQAYYWEIELIEPDDPDDPRYVVLHGEDGEVVGPLTVLMAQAWLDRLNGSRPHRNAVPPNC